MATLAALPSRSGTSIIPSYSAGPTYGTSGSYQARSGELHGRELKAFLGQVYEFSSRYAKLLVPAERIEDDLDYNPVLPVRTYQANVAFVSIGPMPPMKLEYFDD